MISRSNYEIYFVDYFDKRLDEEAKKELFHFLDLNPDLKAEFEKFEQIHAEPDSNIIFAGKEKLKKNTPTLLNYKTWLVAELEGDLSNEQINQLNEFIRKNPSLEEERMKMNEIKLIADEVTFEAKNKLKKSVVVPFRFPVRITSIAAAVAIFILGYLFIFREKDEKIIVNDKKEHSVKENNIHPPTNNFVADQKSPANNDVKEQIQNSGLQKQKSVETTQQNKTANTGMKSIQHKEHSDNSADDQLFSDQLKQKQSDENDTIKSVAPVNNTEPDKFTLADTKKQQIHPSHNFGLDDIFDESDMNDMKENSSKENVKLQNVALKEFEEISGVAVRTNKTESSKTYALSVKKMFSISHTTSK
jgi:hypothetical protein